MIPTSTEIAYFLEIFHVRHVSKAALRLGVTQPTLTQALQKLEGKLKTSLFHRTKQGVIPTSSAVVFYARVKGLRECWEEVQRDINTFTTEMAGTFRVGCHPSVGAYVGPPLLSGLTREAPRISINFVHDSSRRITEKVTSYEVDLGYVVNPTKHPDLVFRKIGEDQVTFWRKKGSVAVPKRIFADRGRTQVEDLLGKTIQKHFSEWSIVESTSLELVRTLTGQGLGIGILPERVAHAENTKLEVYDRNLPSRPDEIYLTYRKEVLSSKAGRELLRLATIQI